MRWKPLLGTYYANFVRYKNTPFQVVVRCQLVFELKEPDKEGRWQFVLTNAVAVSFKKDGGGKVSALVLHQAGKTNELPRDKPVDAKPPMKWPPGVVAE